MFKRILIRVVLRLLDSTLQVDYSKIDKRAYDEWAYKSFDDPGWRSFFAYEDMKILKALGQGPERDQAMILIGRRLQILYMFDEMKKSLENKKSAAEKKESAAKLDNEQP